MNVAIMIRVSTPEQSRSDISIPFQKSATMAYCKAKQWNIHDFYIDDGYSGKNLDRPGIQRLIKDAKAKKFDMVLVWKLDRLSRRQKDVLYLIEDVFLANSIDIASVTENLDTSTAMGRAMVSIMAVFAQLERETIIERVTAAKKEAAEQGRFMGGPIPYGYKQDPTTRELSLDEIEAEVIRWIFREYLHGGMGYQGLADDLTSRKVPVPADSEIWGRTTVRQMIANPFFAGLVKHGEKLFKGKHPAIVSEEDWTAAQKLRAARSNYAPEFRGGLLTGIIYCGECGARMRIKRVWKNIKYKKGKAAYYVCYSQDASCKAMIKNISCRCGYKRVDYIDDYVVHQLRQYSQNERLQRKKAEELLRPEEIMATSKVADKVRRELDGINKKLDRWYSVFESSPNMKIEELNARVDTLRDRRQILEKQLAECEEKGEEARVRETTVTELITAMQNFDANWHDASDEERRAIVLGMIKSVKVYKDDRIDIELGVV
ncbi:recombinase family protein [Anaeroselena agilis]|uniref:Recombinase family protein n=1 Tax=Anaeroselena agilis TaxID=3063788 RepID=A0ABU3NXI7_9FIRM|nr:recombinase family protein [Selenomonadales bacterium 4137-cl]